MVGNRGNVEPLVVTDLDVRLGERQLLQGLSLTVARSECVAVVGPSGSGKSSLLHAVAGFLRPSAGTIRVRGTDIWNADDRTRRDLLRGEVGLIFQFGELLSEISLIENAALPLRINGESRKPSERRAVELLAQLGVDDKVASRKPGQVSGGEAQRAAVARALITGPSVVLADEPTGALDSVAGGLVISQLVGAVRELGVACVVVTHSAEVSARADRVLTLTDGCLVESSGATASSAASR